MTTIQDLNPRDALLLDISDRIDQVIALLKANQKDLLMTLDELKVQVTANTTVEQSAITLIQGLAAQIKASANHPAAIQALSDQLKASSDALAAAVAANTPAAPTPTP